jgi:hypothetical protein
MSDSLVPEAASGKRRKSPYVAGAPAVRVGKPNLSILSDLVLQTISAFVRLPDFAKVVTLALGEPQDRLVVGRQRPLGSKSVLVIPDDLSAIVQTETIQLDLQIAKVVVNTVDEQVAIVRQDSLAFC